MIDALFLLLLLLSLFLEL